MPLNKRDFVEIPNHNDCKYLRDISDWAANYGGRQTTFCIHEKIVASSCATLVADGEAMRIKTLKDITKSDGGFMCRYFEWKEPKNVRMLKKRKTWEDLMRANAGLSGRVCKCKEGMK
ncbi:MAG: hypothetical protein LBT45_02410 [Rickettsiales bacterium]|jgi:hypothetical protein|nr:hypothetical protein [Rickettsiales bacterium]